MLLLHLLLGIPSLEILSILHFTVELVNVAIGSTTFYYLTSVILTGTGTGTDRSVACSFCICHWWFYYIMSVGVIPVNAQLVSVTRGSSTGVFFLLVPWLMVVMLLLCLSVSLMVGWLVLLMDLLLVYL